MHNDERGWLPFRVMDRRRARRGPAFVRGSRVWVQGPFGCRTGPGVVRRAIGRQGNLIVDLDTGKDVLVERRHVRAHSA